PQPVLALVDDLISPREQQPPSMASTMLPLLTLWQEQMVAARGSAAGPSFVAPPATAGRIRDSGLAGRSIPFRKYCSRVSESSQYPTSTAQSNVMPSALTFIRL